MRKIIFFLILMIGFSPIMANPADAAIKKKVVKPTTVTLVEAKTGMLVKEELIGGYRLWYVNPKDKKRYFIFSDQELVNIASSTAIAISAKDMAKIVASAKQKNSAVFKKYKGKFLRDGGGTTWYLNPGDGMRYRINQTSLGDMIIIASRIDSAILKQLPMNSSQQTFDPFFSGVAYVKYNGQNYAGGSYDRTILPLASLSKLMTALVVADNIVNFNNTVVITQEQINYPKKMVGNDATSEVDLRVGDIVTLQDLWVAMLNASSNQAAVILADATGMSRQDFAGAMNDKAKELGLSKTHFEEMSGLSSNNISTAREMAIIAKAAFDNQTIASVTQLNNYVFDVVQNDAVVRQVSVKNRNYSLLAMGAQASKTGFLVEAQRNVALKMNNEIIVVLHAYSTNQRNDIINRLVALPLQQTVSMVK